MELYCLPIIDYIVGVILGVTGPVAVWERVRNTFAGLSQLFNVPIVFSPQPEFREFQGIIFLGDQPDLLEQVADSRLPCLLLQPALAETDSPPSTTYRFSHHPALPRGLRGEVWPEVRHARLNPLPLTDSETPLAWLGDQPVWSLGGRPDWTLYRAVVPLSAFEEDGLSASLSPDRDRVPFVPLIHFLKEIIGAYHRDSPEIPACFIFDDPNLRRMTYGYLDFEELLRRARALRCHVSVATVPLDAVSTKPRVAEIFRKGSDCLSLCIHGNNHTYRELGRKRAGADYRHLLSQALSRVSAIESRYQVRVCRVMEAPHGRVHHSAFAELLAQGFAAANFTPSQFLQCNNDQPWPSTLGWRARECFPGGLCAIPRIVMSRRWRMDLAWAAWLGQPAVVAGHHWDAAAGLGFLEEMVSLLNRWNNVRWSSLSAIARSGYLSRIENQTIALEMNSRDIDLDLSAEHCGLVVARPWLAPGESAPLRISDPATGKVYWDAPCDRQSGSLPIRGPIRLQIRSQTPVSARPVEISRTSFPAWPALRRALTELRDRSSTLLSEDRWLPNPGRRQVAEKILEIQAASGKLDGHSRVGPATGSGIARSMLP